MLAELQEVKRKAWADGDLKSVLAAIKHERDLFGTDAPKKTELSGTVRTEMAVNFDLGQLTDAELDALSAIARRVEGDPEGKGKEIVPPMAEGGDAAVDVGLGTPQGDTRTA